MMRLLFFRAFSLFFLMVLSISLRFNAAFLLRLISSVWFGFHSIFFGFPPCIGRRNLANFLAVFSRNGLGGGAKGGTCPSHGCHSGYLVFSFSIFSASFFSSSSFFFFSFFALFFFLSSFVGLRFFFLIQPRSTLVLLVT